jgi:Lectin C-type domain
LVTITSPAEQLYVENLVLSTEYMGKLWIGMNSKRTNAAFKWVTGEKLKFANWDPSHSPQSVGSTCIVLDLNVAGKWRDEWCKAPVGSEQPGRYDLRFVVEYDCATTSCGALADAADIGQASDGPPCKGEDQRCWVDADCCDGFACRGDSFLYCTQD